MQVHQTINAGSSQKRFQIKKASSYYKTGGELAPIKLSNTLAFGNGPLNGRNSPYMKQVVAQKGRRIDGYYASSPIQMVAPKLFGQTEKFTV